MTHGDAEVALVVLPFYALRWPHVGISYLSSTLKHARSAVTVVDLNLFIYSAFR